MSPLHWCPGNIVGRSLKDSLFRIVKTVESKVTDEGSNSLFHSKRKSNTDNDANPTENECKPEQVRESGLNTQPTPKNDCDTLTAEATVVQQDTESKSDTQAHLEPEILTLSVSLSLSAIAHISNLISFSNF